jgi:hypothetical protein
VSPGLTALGACLGFAFAAIVTPVFAWIVGRIAGEPAPRPLLLGAVAGAVGAVLGAIVVRRSARAFEREINTHLERGRIVTLIEADRADAEDYCQTLEARGALEAIVLPVGLELEAPAPEGEIVAHPFRGDRQEEEGYGATFVAGDAELPAAAARLEDLGVRVAILGRDGRVGPVHSSAAGGQVPAPAPEGGQGWWRGVAPHHGRPIHVRLADGELVLVGDARRLAVVLAGHRNDAISSALARLAERLECPDASARIVTSRIDAGGIGLVVFGPRDARRRAVEQLSAHAVAASEGAGARPEQGRAAA